MKNLILITSVIHTPKKPLSYTKTRSVFNSNERFEQTKKTIHSIIEKIPNYKIIIVECSLLTTEQETYLKSKCDYFLNLYNNVKLRNDIYGLSKSLGEGTMTIKALEYIIKNKLEYDNLFKISGRYWLSGKFDYNRFNNNKIIMKKINNNINNILTAIYKIPKTYVNSFQNFLSNNLFMMKKYIGYEVLFAKFIKYCGYDNCIFLNPIGLNGNVTVCGSFYDG